MADPVSTTASVMTVVSFAAESSRILFKVFHGVTSIPIDVQASLQSLKSLHRTMNNLLQTSTKLDPNHQFPTHFCRRLHECLNDLKTLEAKIDKVDVVLGKRGTHKGNWDGKARRSWERVKWVMIGEQEMGKFLKKVNLYQIEFSLELLTLLLAINEAPTAPVIPSSSAITSAVAPSTVALAPRLNEPISHGCPGPRIRVFCGRSLSTTSNVTLSLEGPSEFLGHRSKSSEAITSGTPASLSLSPSIRVTSSRRWSFMFCDLAIRMGPAMVLDLDGKTRPQSPTHYRKTGFGVGVSLHLSKCIRRRIDIVLYLVQASFLSRTRLALFWDMDCPRIIPRSAGIMRCVEEGLLNNVQSLLSARKASPRDATIHGTTLLHLAAKTGDSELIRLLIQEGADVNAGDEDGDTPLHLAMARKGNFNVARLLIENGADLMNLTVDRKTPLHTLYNDTVQAILLRDDWVAETLPDSQGMSFSHFLAWSSKTTPDLFERGATHDSTDLWSVDSFGRTCLHLTASRGNINLLRYLIERATSTDLNKTDHEGRTALHYAVQSKKPETIELLLARGCSLYAKDNSSRNVLHCAAWWKNLEAAKRFVALDDRGLLLSPDKHGNMPSRLACGPNATGLHQILADLESEANTRISSGRDELLYHSCSTDEGSDTKFNALSATQIWANMMILLSTLLCASLRFQFLPDCVATVILTPIFIGCLLIYVTAKLS